MFTKKDCIIKMCGGQGKMHRNEDGCNILLPLLQQAVEEGEEIRKDFLDRLGAWPEPSEGEVAGQEPDICAVMSFGFRMRAESRRSQRKTGPIAAGIPLKTAKDLADAETASRGGRLGLRSGLRLGSGGEGGKVKGRACGGLGQVVLALGAGICFFGAGNYIAHQQMSIKPEKKRKVKHASFARPSAPTSAFVTQEDH
ncbi:MAG TPA: hypothetical protein VN765_05315 [Candidatus Acidoferrum sp.]|nr:hypothetical protein [Candidatus Acidoferrum sp.]